MRGGSEGGGGQLLIDCTLAFDLELTNQLIKSAHFEKSWILQCLIGHLDVIRSNNLHNLEKS